MEYSRDKEVGWERVSNFVNEGHIDSFDEQYRRQQDNILVVVGGVYLVLAR